MSVSLPDSLLDDLKCSSCGHPISFGPVTRSPSGDRCGRCPSENPEKNFLYEALARTFAFPCKFRESGCDAVLPFGAKMKAHEAFCAKRPYECPIVPLEKCEWRGIYEEIGEHFRSLHGDCALEELRVDLNLDGRTEKRFAYFREDGALFLVDLIYYEGKGLSVELMKVLTDEREVTFSHKYDVVLRSPDGGKITLPRHLSSYVLNSNFLKVANDLIDNALLAFIGRDDNRVTMYFDLHEPSLRPLESVTDIAINNYIFYPCKNRKYGCRYMNYYPETQKHESDCVTYECLLKSNRCEWRGMIERLENHCLKHHEVAINALTVDLNEVAPNGKSTFFFLLKSIKNGLFRVCIKLEDHESADTLMHTVVQCTTQSEDARNFIFELKLDGTAVTNRKSFLCGDLTSDEDAFEYCAHFHYDTLKDSKATFTVRRKNGESVLD